MIDLRFPTALQLVLSLAAAEICGRRYTSEVLAKGLGANPSLVRKLMVPLKRDGIITATLGRNASVRLGRDAREITLKDIYLSVTDDKRFWIARPNVPSICLVSANTGWFFDALADDAEQAALNVLARKTVAQSLDEMRANDCQCEEARLSPASASGGQLESDL